MKHFYYWVVDTTRYQRLDIGTGRCFYPGLMWKDPLVPGGNTTRYQRLDIGTGWCYHPVLIDPFTLVLGENITRYLCLAFGTGWCLPPGTKSVSQVTSKGKYLPLSHNIVVDEVVKKIHMKQEVTDSNPSHCNVPLLPKALFPVVADRILWSLEKIYMTNAFFHH